MTASPPVDVSQSVYTVHLDGYYHFCLVPDECLDHQKCLEELQIFYVELFFLMCSRATCSYSLTIGAIATLRCIRLNPDDLFREFQQPTVPMVGFI